MSLILDGSIHSRAAYFISLIVCHDKNLHVKFNNEIKQYPRFNLVENFSSVGLSNVSRQIVKYAVCSENDALQKKEKEFLLVSNWTMFCEQGFPNAVHSFIKSVQAKNYPIEIPLQFIQLEKELNIPKKTPNFMKYFKSKKKDVFANRDGASLTSEVYESIEDSLINLYKLHNHLECVCEKDLSTLKKQVSSDILEKSDICWPFLCGFNLTVVDLLLLSMLLECLAWIPCLIVAKDFFSKLPSIHKWLLRCTSYIYYKNVTDYVHEMWQKSNFKGCNINQEQYFIYPIAPDIKQVTFEVKPTNPRQMHFKITKNLPLIYDSLKSFCINPEFETLTSQPIDWNNMPGELNPLKGDLDPGRALRKRQQIENMISLLIPILKSGNRVVDFCSGGGHLGIVVAFLRRDCNVVMIENKEESIERAKSRIEMLKLTNVTLFLSNLEYFDEPFDVGVTLHACGSATDLVLEMCFKNKASFIVCPCCYGSIRPTGKIVYPKSEAFSCLTKEQYFLLARSADQTSSDCENEYNKQGKRGMLLIDHDRALNAQSRGSYKTHIYLMIPESCSPKNNILVGIINSESFDSSMQCI